MADQTYIVAAVNDGKLLPSETQLKVIASFLKKHEGERVRVTFGLPSKARSGRQNAYYWGVVLTMIAAETGHTTEEVHGYLKDILLPKVYVSIAGRERQISKSTADLESFMFSEYVDQVRAFAATELNMTIPLPNESDTPSNP